MYPVLQAVLSGTRERPTVIGLNALTFIAEASPRTNIARSNGPVSELV